MQLSALGEHVLEKELTDALTAVCAGRRGKWGGQNKMPRCRSDRAIADELGAVVR